MKVRRARGFDASSEELWKVVGDPYHLPRWWPRVERVENVTPQAWTAVMRTQRGNAVRADYRLRSSASLTRTFELMVAGSPFERIFRSQVTTVAVDGGSVALEIEQQPRRYGRLGAFMLRRGTKRLLDEALDGLEAIVA